MEAACASNPLAGTIAYNRPAITSGGEALSRPGIDGCESC
jgi:hypothetical protein